mmetsp:Transcript_24365/g.45347  ORF Transcript_24365/g.45347 Transcript_24365/m.45347 type:complete len:294 (+) Transcript_24365:81-962(+)
MILSWLIRDSTARMPPQSISQGQLRRGIGGDGLIVLLDGSNGCDYTMRIINADGTEAEMCGNGIRCLALFIQELEGQRKGVDTTTVAYSVSTLAGKIVAEVLPDGSVCVDMGEPEFLPWRDAGLPSYSETRATFPLNLERDVYEVTGVSMGNPHAVVFVNDLEVLLRDGLFQVEGPKLSTYLDAFPEGANAEFAQVLSPSHLRLEVWERGSGHTEACGTGACATVVAGVLRGHVSRNEWCRVTLPGGDLDIKWGTDAISGTGTGTGTAGHVLMKGPAVKAFTGVSHVIEDIFT